MSILGNRVARSEDPRFITGSATFGEDVQLPGMLHATFVRSFLPHARIRSIDTSAVSEIPGALAFTARGGPATNGEPGAGTIDLGLMPQFLPGLNEQMRRPVIASDVVRYVGEIVAVVLTEDRLRGPDAAELVVLDLEELPLVAGPADRGGGRDPPVPRRGHERLRPVPRRGPERAPLRRLRGRREHPLP